MWQTFWSILAGLAATGVSIAIPLLAQRVVDGPVRHRDTAGLWELGGLALAFGVLEALLNFYRRWTQSSYALGMETALRNDLYAHLQRLPVAFHDGWQSGQLLSRVTTDLSVIRRFLSFGLVFLVINFATFVTVVVLLLHLYWPLGAAGRRDRAAAVRDQPRFTTPVQRGLPADAGPAGRPGHPGRGDRRGIRIIKAFGRRRHMTSQFDDRARRVCTTPRSARHGLVATTWPTFDVVPNVTLAVVLLGGAVGGRHRPDDHRRTGGVRRSAADAGLADRRRWARSSPTRRRR